MTECDHDIHDMTVWDKEDLAQQPIPKLHIVSTILAQNEYSDAYDFRQRLEASEAFIKDMLTIIHINAGTHNDYGILSNNTLGNPITWLQT